MKTIGNTIVALAGVVIALFWLFVLFLFFTVLFGQPWAAILTGVGAVLGFLASFADDDKKP